MRWMSKNMFSQLKYCFKHIKNVLLPCKSQNIFSRAKKPEMFNQFF